MGVAKVILNNQTLMDVTQKTVSANNLLSGYTALGADGENVVGALQPGGDDFIVTLSKNSETGYWEPDKTWLEISQAYSNHKDIRVVPDEDAINPTMVSGFWDDYGGSFMYRVCESLPGTHAIEQTYSLYNDNVPFLEEERDLVYPQGTLSISQNGTGIDVSEYATANVSVSVAGNYQSKTVSPTDDTLLVWPDGNYVRLLDGITDSYTRTGTAMTVFYSFPDSGPVPPTRYARINGTISYKYGTSVEPFNVTYDNVIVEIQDSSSIYAGAYIIARPMQDWYPSNVTISGNTGLASSIDLIDITTMSGSSDYRFYILTNRTTASNTIILTDITVDFSDDINFENVYDGLSTVRVEAVSDDLIPIDKIATNTISGTIKGSASYIAPAAFYSKTNIVSAIFSSCDNIGAYAFAHCTSLKTVSFPIATEIVMHAFEGCVELSDVYIPNTSVIGSYAFSGCRTLHSVNFPECTSLYYGAFSGCWSLSYVSFPKCKTIANSAFYACASYSNGGKFGLREASFPSCTIIYGYAFRSCSYLSTISFPLCTHIASYAFYDCYSLTEASFPNASIVSSSAFYACSALATASFPILTSIGSYGFGWCSTLSNTYFPMLKSVGVGAFRYCSALTEISLPELSYINNYAFGDCINLESLYLYRSGVATLTSSTAFANTPMSLSSYLGYFGSIYVPSSLVDAYKSATNWSLYSDRIVGV